MTTPVHPTPKPQPQPDGGEPAGRGDGEPLRFSSDALQCWFGLSYASFLTLPRVLMEAMPFEWQDRMAALLNEYDAAFPNQPDIGTLVTTTDARGKFIKCPSWLLNYRRPDREMIESLRTAPPVEPAGG